MSVNPLKEKIRSGARIDETEAWWLGEHLTIHELSALAMQRKREISGDYVFFNRNIHVEPTNYCIYNCTFCYFRARSPEDGYLLSTDEILRRIAEVSDQITEVHITGGIIPELNLEFYENLFLKINQNFPHISIKGLTAIELLFLSEKANLSLEEVLLRLKKAGLKAIPGGGAELFDENFRQKYFPEKPSADSWLHVHKAAHLMGIPSNATMLMGLGETMKERIHHMNIIRSLQDETHGFQAFIPLLFRSPEENRSITVIEIMKTFAIARLYLDNIPHLKAYWPSLGIDLAQMTLLFGTDDLDGTLLQSTNIYERIDSMKRKFLTVKEIKNLVQAFNLMLVERNSSYEIIR